MRDAWERALASCRTPSGVFVAAAVLGGLVIRARQFFAGRSLWLDEAMVAHSIVDLDLGQLVASPLHYNQRAPAGFLIANDLATVVFGETDDVLRLVPLAAGSLAVILAAVLACRTLASGLARVAFVAAVAFSPVLIYYSVELKQYTLDVATVLVILVANTFWGERSRWWPLAVAGAVCMWFSHVVVLVMGVVWLTRAWEARRGPGRRSVVLVAGVWGVLAVFLAAQVLATSDDAANDVLTSFWVDAFAPVSWSVESLRWYGDSALGLVHLGFQEEGTAGRSVPAAWFDNENYVRLVAVCACIIVLARRRRGALMVPGMVVLLALALSAIEVYPFRGRLILYLLPLLFLVCATAVDSLMTRSAPTRVLALLGAAIILTPTILAGIALGREPYRGPDMEFSAHFVAERFEMGDVIALGPGSRPAFDFYADEVGLAGLETINLSKFDTERVLSAMAGRTSTRLWVVITHRSHESGPMLDQLDSSVRVLERHSSPGTRVRLYSIDQVPLITPGSVSVDEGDAGTTDALVPVELSQPLPEAVTVEWTTVEIETEFDEARAGEDYEAASGIVTFAPGETVQHVSVPVLGDSTVEPASDVGELGFVRFSNPSGQVQLDQSFYGLGGFTIIDDD